MARNKAPRHIRRTLDGRVLAEEQLINDGWAFVTVRSFAVVGNDGEIRVQRPWHEVATGEWDGERHTMTVTWVDGSQPTRFKTTDDAPVAFPRVFKERVDASVVYSESLPVAGGVLRGALRRTPSGELISQISSDTALANSPQLEEYIAALEQKLWDFVGI